MDVNTLLQTAQKAKYAIAQLNNEQRDALLDAIATAVRGAKTEILAANGVDLQNAKGRIADVMLDRLRLDEGRIDAMANGILAVKALPSPLDSLYDEFTHPMGMRVAKIRVPMGVVAIIYESRPNVTTDAAALCIKSGNACVLRGGSDAIATNTVLANTMRAALATALPTIGSLADVVQLVEDTSRDSARALMEARGLVDLLIPRGGKGLISAVVEGARGVPVIETGIGICHIYVDKDADFDTALDIVDNAKTSRPSVCNAAEVCLVHKEIAEKFLPLLAERLQGRVELRLDEFAAGSIDGVPAGPEDFDTEFLDFVLAVGVVDSVNEAIEHINAHGSHHSDCIVTTNIDATARFLSLVDSAAVYNNASTRFTDGGEFGLGCEMGISTQKLGARGPMGLTELTSYKYIIQGDGQIR